MTKASESALPDEMRPERYIEKVSLASGEVVDEPIRPRQLLVHNHRDYHFVDVQARFIMSRIVKATGNEEKARERMKRMRARGRRTSRIIARMIGERNPEKVSRALFGLKDREYYFRYKSLDFPQEEVERATSRMRAEAEAQLAAASVDGRPRIRVLLTGGTGFVGKEIMWQAAHDPEIEEVVVLIRPKQIRDRKTNEVTRTLSPAERGQALLPQLWLDEPGVREKFTFISGDVEKPGLGISEGDRERLERRLTHVVHCAASVAFDDPYEKSFRANVTGTLNALEFSKTLQDAPDSPFVAHIGIETSYIHGRQTKQTASEDEIVFPRNFYNNYYELTKAMASIETERFMLSRGLRVVQLCPSIVIGDARSGNNRGDTKVVNAPVNLFGRAGDTLRSASGGWAERSNAAMLARLAFIFPGDPSAQINMIPVDRVGAGVLAALKRPRAVGERVHLANDNRVTSAQIKEIVGEELEVAVKLAEPTIHRTVTLPLLKKILKRLEQDRLAHVLDKLSTIFGGYSEWGQPIHEVGNDVEVLGLTAERPNAEHAFRMLCRHNRWVQEFGKVKDLDEISRREKIWQEFIHDLEDRHRTPAGALGAQEFRSELEAKLDTESFHLRA